MAVGDFQREVGRRARFELGLELRSGVTFYGLSGLGHLEGQAAEAPPRILAALAALHSALDGSDEKLRTKRRRLLTVDFALGDRVIIEVDELQHFTSARQASLEFYDGVEHRLDVGLYGALCKFHLDQADRYFRTKPAADFPFPGGRTSQRAYLDAVRDLLGHALGYQIIRIASPLRDPVDAVRQLALAVEGLL